MAQQEDFQLVGVGANGGFGYLQYLVFAIVKC